jgi:hypothetical protein
VNPTLRPTRFLQASFDTLPESIQTKVFDVLRLSPGKGNDAGIAMLDLIEQSLTPAELETAEAWLKDLSPETASRLSKALSGSK